MGYLFESEDKVIWSPTMDVGTCFLDQVRSLELLLDTSSGVGVVVSDFVEIDFNAIKVFLQRIGDASNLQNSSMKLLLKGVVVHLLALLTCKESPIQANLYPPDWMEDAKALCQSNMKSIG